MNVYVLMIVCIQSVSLALEDSCTTIPLYEPFESVSSCIGYVEYFKAQQELADPNLYITGFCTTKNYINS
jgi:hypothetical protein